MKNARTPCVDIFGIQRRFCSVCAQGCIGYEPTQIMIPSGLSQFPTFCRNCYCPAHFHMVPPSFRDDFTFPENLVQVIKDFNICSKDINFNCILGAFSIASSQNAGHNI